MNAHAAIMFQSASLERRLMVKNKGEYYKVRSNVKSDLYLPVELVILLLLKILAS